jgi:lysyl-tRNA synthetase, class II
MRIKALEAANALSYPRYPRQTPLQPGEQENAKAIDVPKPWRGRLLNVRRLGNKLAFLDVLVHGPGIEKKVEVVCNMSKLQDTSKEEFEKVTKLMKRGDLVGSMGIEDRKISKVHATTLPVIYAPSLIPWPETVEDTDTLSQHRHMELTLQPKTRDLLVLRSRVLTAIRQTMIKANFFEVQTPLLAGSAHGAVARPFNTTASDLPGRELALRIAPELWLKRLIIGGMQRVFELGPAFRNEAVDTTHNPEFTTCEFYVAWWTLGDLKWFTLALLRSLAFATDRHGGKIPFAHFENMKQLPEIDFVPALEAALGFPLPDLDASDAMEVLVARLAEAQVDIGPGPAPINLPKLLDRLAARLLEPQLAQHPAALLVHHPECMAPLAKAFRHEVAPGRHQRVSARAELYAGGVEAANMYEEENDPLAQRAKLEAQAALNRAGGEDEDHHPGVDESYLNALAAGLPPTGGWGCGVDRLVMWLGGAENIADTLAFGNLRNVVALAKAPTKGAVWRPGRPAAAEERPAVE